MCQGMVGQEAVAARVPAPGGPATAAGAAASGPASGLGSKKIRKQQQQGGGFPPPCCGMEKAAGRDLPAAFEGVSALL